MKSSPTSTAACASKKSLTEFHLLYGPILNSALQKKVYKYGAVATTVTSFTSTSKTKNTQP